MKDDVERLKLALTSSCNTSPRRNDENVHNPPMLDTFRESVFSTRYIVYLFTFSSSRSSMYIVSCIYSLSVNLLMKAIATCNHFVATFSV